MIDGSLETYVLDRIKEKRKALFEKAYTFSSQKNGPRTRTWETCVLDGMKDKARRRTSTSK